MGQAGRTVVLAHRQAINVTLVTARSSLHRWPLQHNHPGKYLDTHDVHPDPEWKPPTVRARLAGLSATEERIRNNMRDLRPRKQLTGKLKLSNQARPAWGDGESSGSSERWRPTQWIRDVLKAEGDEELIDMDDSPLLGILASEGNNDQESPGNSQESNSDEPVDITTGFRHY